MYNRLRLVSDTAVHRIMGAVHFDRGGKFVGVDSPAEAQRTQIEDEFFHHAFSIRR